jgi:hypothetical protein
MVLYIAADVPLPLVAWNEADPGFYVTPVPVDDQAVQPRLTKPHRYYAGAHTGCGCGLRFGECVADQDEDRAGRRSLEGLFNFLRDHCTQVGPLELYSCWHGDWWEEPAHFRTVQLSTFKLGESFKFYERELIQVIP